MKSNLNISVDSVLIEQAKRYAASKQSSLSQIVEIYFKSLTRQAHKKTAIDLLRELPKPKVKVTGNVEELYYGQHRKKYGF